MRPEQLTFAPSNNIENTLRFLRDNCPPDGYLISFSGGKDSLAVLEACKEARVPYRYYMKITTVDPPELTKYVKRCHPECVRLPPRSGKSMYEMIKIRGLPTRRGRWCCDEFKEYVHPMERGQHLLLGVRAAESQQRANTWTVQTCMQTGGYKIAPILRWSDAEVWDFIKASGAEYCGLYDEGQARIGCIGCPLTGNQIDELLRWPWTYPKYREAARGSLKRKMERGYVPAYLWPAWESAKTSIAEARANGASKAQIVALDAEKRAEAMDWMAKQDPEYLMRRVMAWWLECPVDYWKLSQLEDYALSRAARKAVNL
jgi:phosphoadenosine phosphosulfate reductase